MSRLFRFFYVSNEIYNFKTKLQEIIGNNYTSSIIRKDMTELEEQDAIKRPDFKKGYLWEYVGKYF